MNTHSSPSNDCPLNYLKQVFTRPFPRINLTTTKEITEIIKSLKSTHSLGYDEIPWLHFVLLVSDLIMSHEVFDLLLEVKSKLL